MCREDNFRRIYGALENNFLAQVLPIIFCFFINSCGRFSLFYWPWNPFLRTRQTVLWGREKWRRELMNCLAPAMKIQSSRSLRVSTDWIQKAHGNDPLHFRQINYISIPYCDEFTRSSFDDDVKWTRTISLREELNASLNIIVNAVSGLNTHLHSLYLTWTTLFQIMQITWSLSSIDQ